MLVLIYDSFGQLQLTYKPEESAEEDIEPPPNAEPEPLPPEDGAVSNAETDPAPSPPPPQTSADTGDLLVCLWVQIF